MEATWNVNRQMREHAQTVSATNAERARNTAKVLMWVSKQLSGLKTVHLRKIETGLSGLAAAAQERVGDVASGDAGATTTGSVIGRGRLRDCCLYSKRWSPLALHIMSRPDQDSTACQCSTRPYGRAVVFCGVIWCDMVCCVVLWCVVLYYGFRVLFVAVYCGYYVLCVVALCYTCSKTLGHEQKKIIYQAKNDAKSMGNTKNKKYQEPYQNKDFVLWHDMVIHGLQKRPENCHISQRIFFLKKNKSLKFVDAFGRRSYPKRLPKSTFLPDVPIQKVLIMRWKRS